MKSINQPQERSVSILGLKARFVGLPLVSPTYERYFNMAITTETQNQQKQIPAYMQSL